MTATFRGAARRPGRAPGITSLAVVALLAPVAAHAGDDSATGFYVAGKGGPILGYANAIGNGGGRALSDDDALNGIGGFGMAAGYTWAHAGVPLRTEVEFINRTEISYNASPLFAGTPANDAVGSDIQNITTLVKGYWHFASGDPVWSPFVSAGLGWSRTAVSGQYTPAGSTPAGIDTVTSDVAWTAGVGASLYLGNRIVNDIELSYVDLGSADWGRPAETNLHSDSLSAVQLTFALRYNF